MGILSGLENLGLGKLSGAELYEKEEKKEKSATPQPAAKKELKEEDYLFAKTYKCPVCDEDFKSPTVRSSKARLIGTDIDLRPKYEGIDISKYEIVACPRCGYAAHLRYFDSITTPQAKLVRENISRSFRHMENKEIFSYEEAFTRYQLALGNCVVKKAKASEKAYVCLRMAWLVRGKMENYDLNAPDYDAVADQLKQDEQELLLNAFEGFMAARQSESFPIAGMDEMTLDYILAVLSMKFAKYDIAQKFISTILGSPSANSRIKDKARDLKEQLKNLM